MAAGAFFTDSDGRVLLVRPTYKDHWEIPGGFVEPGESPREACEREIHEELGLTLSFREMLVVDWAPTGDENDKILFIFDAEPLTADQLGQIKLPAAELAEWRYVELAGLAPFVPDRLTRRLHTAAAARELGRPTYAERGLPL